MGMGETSVVEKQMSAGGTINEATIVKFGADDENVVAATAVSETLVGVAQHAAASGERVRVMTSGISRLKIGGTVTRGDYVTTNGSAQGVAAAPAGGTNNGIIGIALQSGVNGDIIRVQLAQGRIQG